MIILIIAVAVVILLWIVWKLANPNFFYEELRVEFIRLSKSECVFEMVGVTTSTARNVRGYSFRIRGERMHIGIKATLLETKASHRVRIHIHDPKLVNVQMVYLKSNKGLSLLYSL